MQCPNVVAGYSTLSANLIRFSDRAKPVAYTNRSIDLSRLDEVEATFMEHGVQRYKKVSLEESKSDCSPPRMKIRPSRATLLSTYKVDHRI